MRIEITPAVVVPDMSPLVHLAAGGCLPLLQEFGRVVVMDIVAFEASSDPNKPWAQEVASWLAKKGTTGRPHPVEVATTEIGEAYRLAREANPQFRLRNAGEHAIRDWLLDTLSDIGGPALVVYEDKSLPKLLRRERLDEVVVAATTRALLAFAAERGLIGSAEDAWDTIVKRAPSANPRADIAVMRPMPAR